MNPTLRAQAGASLRLGLVLVGVHAGATGLGPADVVARPVRPRPMAVVAPVAAPAPAPAPTPFLLVPVAAPVPEKVWPLAGAMTGWFGEPRGGHLHPGMDLDGDTGDPVVAAAAGKVVHAGPAPAGWSGYGLLVVVDHGDGVQTAYAHLSSVAVPAGRAVAPGERIGAVGSTGSSSGSHLHFEVRLGGVPVNPKTWMPPR